MHWNREKIDHVAKASAAADYWAFERVGLTEIEDASVLDVGCFDGFNTHLKFAPYRNIKHIVGIDPCEEAIELAKGIGADARFTWENVSLEDFDAKGALFDLIYLSHTFQHLPDKAAAAAKLYSLLAPGGCVIIKTVDDSAKISFPDPNGVMEQVMGFYDASIRPYAAHTESTDRNNGSKCPSLLAAAGFMGVQVDITHTSTCGLDKACREELFERLTYFRRGKLAKVDEQAKRRMAELLDAWHEIFLEDGYYFDSPTFMVVGWKPDARVERGQSCCGEEALVPPWSLSPMKEDDLAEVMSIEIAAFPCPWTPVAYAMELRHNPAARYCVARNEEGRVCGYIGWWVMDTEAAIMRVATDPKMRRRGLGKVLVEHACTLSAKQGAHAMLLNVRVGNEGARAFYRDMGFNDCGLEPDYFDSPTEDAVNMCRIIGL